ISVESPPNCPMPGSRAPETNDVAPLKPAETMSMVGGDTIQNPLRILIVAPHLDGADVGESFTAYKLVAEMSRHAHLTVLAYECRHGPPLAEQLPLAEV